VAFRAHGRLTGSVGNYYSVHSGTGGSRRIEGVSPTQAFMRNCRNQNLVVRRGLSLRETRVCYGSKVSSRCLRSVTIFLRGPRFCRASEKWRPVYHSLDPCAGCFRVTFRLVCFSSVLLFFRGQDGVASLSCGALTSPTMCRFSSALSVHETSKLINQWKNRLVGRFGSVFDCLSRAVIGCSLRRPMLSV
jgi:hypothetical protein